jgi:hypothetical protein
LLGLQLLPGAFPAAVAAATVWAGAIGARDCCVGWHLKLEMICCCCCRRQVIVVLSFVDSSSIKQQ